MTDDPRDLLRRARGGDREAIDRLLEETAPRLRRLAEIRLGEALKAKIRISDVLQSTYLDVLRSVGEFRGETEDEFVAWVVRALENNIRDQGKYFGARKRRAGDAALDEGRVAGPGTTPSATAAFAEDLHLVHCALDNLAADHREVILLRMVDGRSHAEIADRLGRTQTATRMLLVRARAGLLVEIERLRSEGGEERGPA